MQAHYDLEIIRRQSIGKIEREIKPARSRLIASTPPRDIENRNPVHLAYSAADHRNFGTDLNWIGISGRPYTTKGRGDFTLSLHCGPLPSASQSFLESQLALDDSTLSREIVDEGFLRRRSLSAVPAPS